MLSGGFSRRAGMLSLIGLLFTVAPVLANGIIIPVPPPIVIQPPVRPMPQPVRPLIVKKDIVKVNITGGVVQTEVDEVFYNPNARQLEGTYIFPLPEGANISKFVLYINGEPVEAELLTAEKARQIYEDIVRRMIDPALLEFAGRNLFKARVFPIPANGERRVVLTYTESLSPDASVWTYRYPLSIAKFSPAPVEEVNVTISAKVGRKVSTVYSTSHPGGKIEKKGEDEFTYTYVASNVLPQKDLFLHYVTAAGDIVASPVVHRAAGEDGYVMLLISAGEAPEKDAVPKDIVFVVDTSGSMRGNKIKQAQAALKYCVEGLLAEDRFEIVSFSTEARPLFSSLQPADDAHRKQALENVANMTATGGTNMEEALTLALKALASGKDAGRPAFVIFLTDGIPTVGERDADTLVKMVLGKKAGSRFFMFGVGDDLNAFLIDQLARDTGGVKTYVGTEEDLELKLSSFYAKIARPALTDISITATGVTLDDIYPKKLPDVFYGQEMVLMGRVKGSGEGDIVVKGKRGNRDVEVRTKASFPEDVKCPGLSRLWAARKVAYLLEIVRLEGETEDLRREIVDLAKKYGIITPYTSMLVVEDTATTVPTAPGVRGPRPEAPAPLADAGIRRKAGEARVAFDMEAGKSAVAASRELNQMAQIGGQTAGDRGRWGGAGGMAPAEKAEADYEEALVMDEARELVKHVADKTFYKSGRYWQDSEFKANMKVNEVKYLSDEYFALLKDDPQLGKYLAVGTHVIVVWKGEAYKIIE